MLYVVSTPIGNMGDITLRASQTLASVDFIAAEDTRVAGKLLSLLKISKPTVSYYEHNRASRGAEIVARLLSGESCALITDAGTPCISDPGAMLVRQCREAGIGVAVVPGACAAVAAYSLSGIDGGRFCFEGFLSVNKPARRRHLESLKDEQRPMIFYEAPHKLRATLASFAEMFGGERRITVARELTKLHEECFTVTLEQAIEKYRETEPRGEYVLIIDGAPERDKPDLSDALSLARAYVESGMSDKDAARRASDETGVPKNAVYSNLIT